MSTQLAFLRAINVGGRAILKMQELRSIFAAAGATDVRTCIQSGNVLFECRKERSMALRQTVRERLRERLGQEVAVLYRSALELQQIVATAPFNESSDEPDLKRYVGLLGDRAADDPALPIRSVGEGLDIVQISRNGMHVFLLSRPVKGRYGFPNKLIEQAFGVAATTRNWNTIMRLAELVRSDRHS